MSLHPIAEAVRSQGRNGDSMLVHMTPGEVAALQQMAEANGGTLTINPETGQPEAFFLASLLPMIAGAMAPSLATAGGIMGTLFGSPLMSGLTVGGLTGLVTGDMEKGLMAGLGAYGGYGLGQSLMGAGAATAAPSVTPAVTAGGPAVPTPPVPAAVPKAAIPAMPDASTLNQMGGFSTSADVGGFGSVLDPVQRMRDPEGALAEMARVSERRFNPAFSTQQQIAAQQQLAGLPDLPRTTPPVTYTPELIKPTVPALEQALAQSDSSGFATQSPMQAAIGQAGASVGEMGTGIQNVLAGKTPGGIGGFLTDNAMNIGMAAAPMISGVFAEKDGVVETTGDTERYYYPDFTLGRATPEQVAAQRASFGAPEAGLPYSTKEVNYYPGFSYGERRVRSVADGGEIKMAEGGEIQYDFDPVTGTFKRKETPADKIAAGQEAQGAGPGGFELGSSIPSPVSMPTPNPNAGQGENPFVDFVSAIIPGIGLGKMLTQGLPGLMRGDLFQTPVTPSGGYTPVPFGGQAQPAPPGGWTMEDYSDLAGAFGGSGPSISGTGPSISSGGVGLGSLTPADALPSGDNTGPLAAGGAITAMSYKRGGLKEDSFIVPADVLAALGNGSNDAGLAALNKMLAKANAPRAEKIDGPGDGMSDDIPTSIEGRQPARVAKDEAYVPTEAVRRLGGGDVKKGAKKLYNLMARVRKAAHGDDKQQRRVNPDKVARV
jgi:hypothetical protein